MNREHLLVLFEAAYHASMAQHHGTEPKLAREAGLNAVLEFLATMGMVLA